jgi:hypothetical protein
VLIPKKSELTLAKSQAPSRLQIYLVDGEPILVDTSGKGRVATSSQRQYADKPPVDDSQYGVHVNQSSDTRE